MATFAVYKTFLNYASIWVGLIVLAIIAIGFRRSQKPKNHLVVMVLISSLLLAPLSSLTYVYLPHLNDPERVFLPIGLFSSIVTLLILRQFEFSKKMKCTIASITLLTILATTSNSILYWTNFNYIQRDTIAIVSQSPILDNEKYELVVADYSGELGDVYTFLPPILDIALDVSADGKKASVSICTPQSVVRKHPVAEKFPISTTPTCDELLSKTAEIEFKAQLRGREIIVYSQPRTVK
jgi:hypothetical protein